MKDNCVEEIKEFKNKYIFKENLSKEELKEEFHKLKINNEIIELETLLNNISKLNQEDKESAIKELKNTLKDIAISRLYDDNFKEIKEYLIYVDKRIEAKINDHDYTVEEQKEQAKAIDNFIIDSLKEKEISLELFIESKINEFDDLEHTEKIEEFEKLMTLINEEKEGTKEILSNNLIEKIKKALVVENYSNGNDFAKDVKKVREIIFKNLNFESKLNSVIEKLPKDIEEKIKN